MNNDELALMLKEMRLESKERDVDNREWRKAIDNKLQTITNDQAALHQRVNVMEGRHRTLENSQIELESSLMVEMGKLGANDKDQNKKLDELLDDKKFLTRQLKAAKWLIAGVPGAWLALQWALTHIH